MLLSSGEDLPTNMSHVDTNNNHLLDNAEIPDIMKLDGIKSRAGINWDIYNCFIFPKIRAFEKCHKSWIQ